MWKFLCYTNLVLRSTKIIIIIVLINCWKKNMNNLPVNYSMMRMNLVKGDKSR